MYRIFVAHVSVSRECRSCVSGSELNMCGRNEKHNRFFQESGSVAVPMLLVSKVVVL